MTNSKSQDTDCVEHMGTLHSTLELFSVSGEADYMEGIGLCLVPTTSPNDRVKYNRVRLNRMTMGVTMVFSHGQEKLGTNVFTVGQG